MSLTLDGFVNEFSWNDIYEFELKFFALKGSFKVTYWPDTEQVAVLDKTPLICVIEHVLLTLTLVDPKVIRICEPDYPLMEVGGTKLKT